MKARARPRLRHGITGCLVRHKARALRSEEPLRGGGGEKPSATPGVRLGGPAPTGRLLGFLRLWVGGCRLVALLLRRRLLRLCLGGRLRTFLSLCLRLG